MDVIKLCECGCGLETPLATTNRKERNQAKGLPVRFIKGHNNRGLRGPQTSQWKGGTRQKLADGAAIRRAAKLASMANVPPYSGDGKCKCGCGKETVISDRSDPQRGWVKGHPRPYIRYHWPSSRRGVPRKGPTGSRFTNSSGYVLVYAPWRPNVTSRRYVYEHVLVVEQAIGRYLIYPEQVHHLDHNRSNNVIENLHLCRDMFEHKMMHRWENARTACGHSDWRKCRYCKQWGPPETMTHNSIKHAHTITGAHLACRHAYDKKRRGDVYEIHNN